MIRNWKASALVLMSLVSLSISPADAQTVTSTVYNVRMVVATEIQAAGPNKWLGDVEWFIENQGFHYEACTAYMNPYGNTVPNGPYQFDGDHNYSNELAYWCWNAMPGTCVKVNVEVLDKATKFGNTYRVSSIVGGC